MGLGETITARLKEIGGAWSSYTALGTFALYLLGYLSLRFKLTFLGIGSDIAVLDERYFYEGAKFVVYLVSALPIVLLIVLAVSACGWVPYRFLPSRIRTRMAASLRRRGRALAGWCGSPIRLSLAGIVFSIVVIQFVMRQPLLYSNLLVARDLPDHLWLRGLLLTPEEGLRSLYFSGLVAATAATVAIAVIVGGQAGQGRFAQGLRSILVTAAAIQFLFLPINYGFLITATELPRVAIPDGGKIPAVERETWLAWEGKDGVTYLVRDRTGGIDRRSLLTLPRKDVGRIEIVGYDPILRVLFVPSEPAARARR